MTPKVSVIIPAFNSKKTIKRSVKSAIKQTYKRLEIIVVDDGSTDNTCKVARDVGDRRVETIKLDSNHGVARARNVGIENSTGEFVAFLDADDEWKKKKLEKQLSCLTRSDRDVAVVDCDWEIVSNTCGVAMTKSQGGATDRKKLLSFYHVCSPPTVIARRHALQEVGCFDENIPTAEDADLWVRLSKKYAFEHVPEALVKVHRGHENRLGLDTKSVVKGHLKFYTKHEEKYQKNSHIESSFFMNLGRKLMSMGNLSMGRKYICRSIKTNPVSRKKYAFLIASFLSLNLYQFISNVKNRVLCYKKRVERKIR